MVILLSIAAVLLGPLVQDWLYQSAKRQKAIARGDSLVFPVSRGARILGVFCAAFFVGLTIWVRLAPRGDVPQWIATPFLLFALSGVWICLGEFHLNQIQIEKKFLWLKKALPWPGIESLQGKWGGYALAGRGGTIWVWPHYADYDRLVQEIRNRTPQLRHPLR